MIRFRDRWAEREVCAIAAAVIGAVGATVGGIAQASAAKHAANAQVSAQQAAIAEQQQMFNTVRGDLAPYNQGGQADFSTFNQFMSGSNAQKMAILQGMPGYQFALTQGLKAVQNSASARGLGVSGAAQKGAAAYATGLASENWQSFINPLLSGAQLGENAAAMSGQLGANIGGNIAQSLVGIGQAQAGGAIGIGNALSGAAGGIGQNLLLANMFGGGGGMFGGGGGAGGVDYQYAPTPTNAGALWGSLMTPNP